MNRRLTFSIQEGEDPSGPVVELAGEIDLNAVPYIEQAMRVAADKGRNVILDLSEATFLDSPTIGVLVNWTERLQAAQGRLAIVCTNADILRVFRQIGLDQTLDVVDSRAAAAP